MEEQITGVILIGGSSSRMGRDKTFLEVDGKPIFERILEVFSANFAKVALVGSRPDRFDSYRLPVLPDIYTGSALGGVYTGLYHAQTPYIFVSSCDLPYPNGKLLRHLCSLREGFDAVVPSTPHGLEPLFALYSKSCLPAMEAFLESGQCCAYGYYPDIKVRHALPAELAPFDPEGSAFINVNTPEQYAQVAGKGAWREATAPLQTRGGKG